MDGVSGLLTGFPSLTKFLRMIFLHNRELMVTKAKRSSRSFTASLAVFSAQRQLSKIIKTNVNSIISTVQIMEQDLTASLATVIKTKKAYHMNV